jgi:hypothetical protein
MKKIEIEILSDTPNCPVVQMPNRKFPGMVLQGDSLRILLDAAEEIYELSGHAPNAELSDEIVSLREKLAAYVSTYEEAMRSSGRNLPYPKRR